MTTKKVLLALAATSLLTLGLVAPVSAQDDPAPGDEGTMVDAPADPDGTGDSMSDPGMEDGGATGAEGGGEEASQE